jgi:hypothetical protein
MNIEPAMNFNFDPADLFPTSKEVDILNDLEDVSEWLNQNLVEVNHEEGLNSSLILSDRLWTSLDFTMDSLEPASVRPTESVFMNPPDISSHGDYLNSFDNVVSLSTQNDASIDEKLSSAPLSFLSRPARTMSARDAVDDSCYIRPFKIARMVSNSSFSQKSSMDVSSPESRVKVNQCNSLIPIKKALESPHAVSHANKTSKTPKRDRFRIYQNDQWNDRYQELKDFKAKHGHCLVPHNHLHQGSPALAQWVKRQRFQYKQSLQNKRTTITEERKRVLEELGFIWDSHAVAWEEKYQSLLTFEKQHGHVDVPSNHEDKNLAIWIKCQRRQYKLLFQGRQSAMAKERISRLEAVQFNWNPRNL